MDVQGGFEPTETSGFINIQAIRIKKWGEAK
jgi:argininosuccinate synthase